MIPEDFLIPAVLMLALSLHAMHKRVQKIERIIENAGAEDD